MKGYILVIIVILTSTIQIFSQGYQNRESLDFYRNYKMKAGEWKIIISVEDFEGSPYLNDEFVKGEISTNIKQHFVDIPLRYNIYSDQIEFKTPENQIRAFARSEIIENVVFDDIKMVYLPYLNAKKIRKGYFKVILEGYASLYARHQVLFIEATKAAHYIEAEPAKFLTKPDTYYITIGSAQAKKVGGKKELIAIFPKHNKEVETFIKKNKIKSGKPESLKKLVQYYNTLE